jgi:hypothetical protein
MKGPAVTGGADFFIPGWGAGKTLRITYSAKE